MTRDVAAFVAEKLGHMVKDGRLFEAAVTHSSSTSSTNYERLEFLGDRVLGLVIARWLYERFPNEAQGELSQRLNTLVDRSTCGKIGRQLGLPAVIRLGKQARGDGANEGDNVVGDVVEALIGALYLDGGLERAEAFIRRLWNPLVEEQRRAPKHPKAALQELAAARSLPNPAYEILSRSGTDHSPRFTVRVAIEKLGEAQGEGASKQDAETKAAIALLDKLA
jgi:ribonuclease III